MKKNRNIPLVKRLISTLLFVCLCMPTFARLQSKKVSINLYSVSVQQVVEEIGRQTGIGFLYKGEDLKKHQVDQASFNDQEWQEVLLEILEPIGMTYKMEKDVILIVDKPNEQYPQETPSRRRIKGKVSDEKGETLPGVNIIIKESGAGTTTDIDGNFSFLMPKDAKVLMFSFIGYETLEVDVTDKLELDVVLQLADNDLGEVVVNGLFQQNKNSYTGAVTTIKAEELLSVSNTNLIEAMATLTPDMRIVENNDMGSNPNHVPELIIRGTTSLALDGEAGLNSPLIILDGVEISMTQLYDLNLYDIERVDVLKDASATVMYGEKAANGVIVVTRKKVTESDVRLRYNFVPQFSFPETSSFDLCNAEEKLELERLAGMYDSPVREFDAGYLRNFSEVKKGVNTDWLSQPLRTAYTFNHSLSMTGRGSNMDYGATMRYTDGVGVMKGDYRKNMGLGIYYSYHLANALTITYRVDFRDLKSQNTPYGKYSDYVKMNPYNRVYDEFGNMIPEYIYLGKQPVTMLNPMYNVFNTSSFDKNSSSNVTNSINLRWQVSDKFYINAAGNMSSSKSKSDNYLSPEAAEFVNQTNPDLRGSYVLYGSEGMTYSGNTTLNYSLQFDQGTVLGFHVGGNIQHNKTSTYGFTAQGFLKDQFTDVGFASGFPDGSTPSGKELKTAEVGGFSNMNFIYRNRYYVDGSIRLSGSSRFGKDERFAPFWSAGFGWNIHNEAFLNATWVDALRLKFSTGIVGSVSFPAYQAITTYRYEGDLIYYNGIGAVPIQMGNPDLEWQPTLNHNISFTGNLFNNRLSFDMSYYQQITDGLLFSMNVPPSIGVTEVRINLGKMKNAGYAISLSGAVIENRNVTWRLSYSTSYTMDKILEISDVLASRNEENKSDVTEVKPRVLFEEGESQSAIYAVRSAGINPANGREVYITKDGQYTYDYNTDDKVAVGNTKPDMHGAITSVFRYKRFSITTAMNYTIGGDIYNATLAEKVEYIDPRYNVDRRAFTERWKTAGDITPFLGIPENNMNRFHTSRFVQERNELFISSLNFNYEFASNSLKKIGLKRLRVGFGLGDVARFSTVKFERGTSYPYSRSYNFTFSPTF